MMTSLPVATALELPPAPTVVSKNPLGVVVYSHVHEVWQHLSAALEQQRLPHAFIFKADSVVSQHAVSLWLAQALNCQHLEARPNATVPSQPCGTCVNCRWIATHSHPAVQWLTRFHAPRDKEASVRSQLTKELVTTAMNQWALQARPNEHRLAVFCNADVVGTLKAPPHEQWPSFDPTHLGQFLLSRENSQGEFIQTQQLTLQPLDAFQLSKAVGNMLLKTLEEPPPRTSFIFWVQDSSALLSTIVSRCQLITFKSKGGMLDHRATHLFQQHAGVTVWQLSQWLQRLQEATLAPKPLAPDTELALATEALTLATVNEGTPLQGVQALQRWVFAQASGVHTPEALALYHRLLAVFNQAIPALQKPGTGELVYYQLTRQLVQAFNEHRTGQTRLPWVFLPFPDEATTVADEDEPDTNATLGALGGLFG